MIGAIPLQFDFFGIFANINAFMVFYILIGGMIGAFSRKLALTAFGALLTYAYVVINTDIFIFDAMLYLVLFIIALWASSFAVRGYLEGNSEGE